MGQSSRANLPNEKRPASADRSQCQIPTRVLPASARTRAAAPTHGSGSPMMIVASGHLIMHSPWPDESFHLVSNLMPPPLRYGATLAYGKSMVSVSVPAATFL